MGLLVFSTGQYAYTAAGEKEFRSIVLPELSFSGCYPIQGDLGFAPMISFTPLGHNNPDSGLTTRVLRVEGKLTYLVSGGLGLQAGLGVENTIMRGSGGTVQLKNGNDVTTFGLPSKAVLTSLFYGQLGLGFELMQPLRFDLSIFAIGLLSSSRALNYSFALSYGFL